MTNSENDFFCLIKEFYNEHFWETIRPSQLLAIQLSDREEPVFISIVGDDDTERGVFIYRSIEELTTYFETHQWSAERDAWTPFQFRANHTCIALKFIDRTDLTAREYKLIKDTGVPFRGKRAWPILSDYAQGFEPAPMKEKDEFLMKSILSILIEERIFLSKIEEYEQTLEEFDIPLIKRGKEMSVKKEAYTLPIDLITGAIQSKEGEQPVWLSPFEIKRVQSLPLGRSLWEMDMQYINTPITVSDQERKMYPKLLLLSDPARKVVLESEVLLQNQVEKLQRIIIQKMIGENVRPPQIAIEGIQAAKFVPLIKNLLNEIDVDFLIVEELPYLTMVKEQLRDEIDEDKTNQ